MRLGSDSKAKFQNRNLNSLHKENSYSGGTRNVSYVSFSGNKKAPTKFNAKLVGPMNTSSLKRESNGTESFVNLSSSTTSGVWRNSDQRGDDVPPGGGYDNQRGQQASWQSSNDGRNNEPASGDNMPPGLPPKPFAKMQQNWADVDDDDEIDIPRPPQPPQPPQAPQAHHPHQSANMHNYPPNLGGPRGPASQNAYNYHDSANNASHDGNSPHMSDEQRALESARREFEYLQKSKLPRQGQYPYDNDRNDRSDRGERMDRGDRNDRGRNYPSNNNEPVSSFQNRNNNQGDSGGMWRRQVELPGGQVRREEREYRGFPERNDHIARPNVPHNRPSYHDEQEEWSHRSENMPERREPNPHKMLYVPNLNRMMDASAVISQEPNPNREAVREKRMPAPRQVKDDVSSDINTRPNFTARKILTNSRLSEDKQDTEPREIENPVNNRRDKGEEKRLVRMKIKALLSHSHTQGLLFAYTEPDNSNSPMVEILSSGGVRPVESIDISRFNYKKKSEFEGFDDRKGKKPVKNMRDAPKRRYKEFGDTDDKLEGNGFLDSAQRVDSNDQNPDLLGMNAGKEHFLPSFMPNMGFSGDKERNDMNWRPNINDLMHPAGAMYGHSKIEEDDELGQWKVPAFLADEDDEVRVVHQVHADELVANMDHMSFDNEGGRGGRGGRFGRGRGRGRDGGRDGGGDNGGRFAFGGRRGRGGRDSGPEDRPPFRRDGEHPHAEHSEGFRNRPSGRGYRGGGFQRGGRGNMNIEA